MLRYEFHKAVEAELVDAADYYDAQRDGLGDEFLEEFWRALDWVREFPEAWQLVTQKTRRCRLRRFPYGIFYQVHGEVVFVLTVGNLRREPGYWRGRERPE